MTTPQMHPLESILRLCAAHAPQPWYPSEYAKAQGISRDSLDPFLDELRLGGLVRLTDWVQGFGQGYALTEDGVEVLESPRLIARLSEGKVPVAKTSAAPKRPHREFSAWNRGEWVRAAFLEKRQPVVTTALILINVLVFFAGLALAYLNHEPLNQYIYASTGRVLHATGAVHSVDLRVNHEWWRLLTACFVHVGLLHLGVNMYSLYVIGPLVERIWGSGYFLVLYLIAGLGGSCAAMVYTPQAMVAGASGALWGIMASMLTWIFLNRGVLAPQFVRVWLRALLINFGLNFAITFGVPNISAGAHFGGGAVGLMAAIPLDYLLFGRGIQRALAVLVLALIPVGSVTWMVRSFDRDPDVAMNYFMPEVGQAMRQADKANNHEIEPVLDLKPAQRNAEAVARAAAAIRKTAVQIHTLLLKGQRLAKPTERRTRNLMELTVQLLQHWEEYLKLCDDCLRQGEDWSFENGWQLKVAKMNVANSLRRWEDADEE